MKEREREAENESIKSARGAAVCVLYQTLVLRGVFSRWRAHMARPKGAAPETRAEITLWTCTVACTHLTHHTQHCKVSHTIFSKAIYVCTPPQPPTNTPHKSNTHTHAHTHTRCIQTNTHTVTWTHPHTSTNRQYGVSCSISFEIFEGYASAEGKQYESPVDLTVKPVTI